MKKRMWGSLVLGTFVICGCSGKDNKDNSKDKDNNVITHHFSKQYTYNDTRHWHACEDEGCLEKSGEEFHDFDEWEYDSYASGSTKGQRHRQCQTCDYSQVEEHEYTEGNVHECSFSEDWEKNDEYHWNACTGTYNNQPCTKKEHYEKHTYGPWVIDKYATVIHDASGNEDIVSDPGIKHRECTVCKYVETVEHKEEEPVGQHEHAFESTWASDENNHWHPCGYGKVVGGGYGGRDLYRCEEKGSFGPHTWDTGRVTTNPTTTSEGVKTYTCTVCSATKTESILPLVDNTDGSESITVNFNQLEGKQAATVNPKTKAYLDAMKAAEPNVINPYKMQELKNGVDVCDYLSKEDYKDEAGQGHNKPQGVTLSWDKGTMDYESAIIKYATKADMSDALEVSTNGTSVKVNNLYANTKYFYQLTYTKGTTLYKSNIATFETADYIRFIDMGLVYNVRDMGNYKTSFGGRVKQGLIYRGSELTPTAYNDNNGSHPKNIDTEVLNLQKNVLKIKVEIDHRSKSESNNLTGSPLGSDVEYKRENYKVSAYDNYVNGSNSTDITNIFNAFAEADTKHVYFHCIGGADRTGCVAFTLLGMLGVSYSDTIADFEVTTSTNWPRCRNVNDSQHYSRFPDFYRAFTSYSTFDASKSFKDNCVAFLKSKGVTDATIEKIRSVMIEGYTSSNSGNTNSGNTNSGNTNTGVHTEKTHVWSTEQKTSTAGCVDMYSATCSCGKKKLSFKGNSGTLGSGSSYADNVGEYMKLKATGNTISYKINVPTAIN